MNSLKILNSLEFSSSSNSSKNYHSGLIKKSKFWLLSIFRYIDGNTSLNLFNFVTNFEFFEIYSIKFFHSFLICKSKHSLYLECIKLSLGFI